MSYCLSFSQVSLSQHRGNKICDESSLSSSSTTTTTTALQGGLFGGDSDILKNMFQPKEESNDGGPKSVLTITAGNVKPRPLKFFLQIYLVGELNTKDNQQWFPKEGENESSLEIYYKDGTGMCKIIVESNLVAIERHGQRPSLEYLLQESVMLHGVLDEIYKLAFDETDDVKDDQRLIKLENEDAIDKAREKLPARQA